jgi:2-polyprenyl-3-methyl-5-hydroxy-6-metoxy-1,4-benzoquinol methylase
LLWSLDMAASDAELEAAWRQVQEKFPFPDYIKVDKNQIDVGRQVSRFLARGSRVVDIGAGPADKTGVVAALGYACTAMDDLGDLWHNASGARERILKYAESMGIEYILLKGEIPPTDVEFDMVMSHDMVEHLPDSPRYLLSEMMSRVRTGGYLYLTVPSHVNIRKRIAVLCGKTSHSAYELYYWSPIPNRGHFREYTRGDCIKLASSLGLELVEVKGWHQGLRRVPRWLLWPYLAFTAVFPNTRDSWRLIASKPPGWAPKLELTRAEMLEYTGLTCWDDLGH